MERSDTELKQIALDLESGLILTDRHLRDPNDMDTVFMPLALMTEEQFESFMGKSPGMLFEYYSKASSRTINGMPTFFSVQVLSIDERDKVIGYWKKIKEVLGKALNEV